MDQQGEKKKDETERITGLGRRTRNEIVKWNQMTALRFKTGWRHQTSPASPRGLENDAAAYFTEEAEEGDTCFRFALLSGSDCIFQKIL